MDDPAPLRYRPAPLAFELSAPLPLATPLGHSRVGDDERLRRVQAGRVMSASPSCPICAFENCRAAPWGEHRYGDFAYRYVECGACSSYFADPMPGPDELQRMYGPAYVEEHYRELGGSDGAIGEIARELDDTAALVAAMAPRARVLDVGCGAGVFLQRAAGHGLRAVGHELNEAAAARTADRIGIAVLTGSLVGITERFDVVHAADVIEHLPSPLDALNEMKSLLASDGRLVLRGPLERQRSLFESMLTLRARARGRIGVRRVIEAAPYHVLLFTLRGWRRLLARGGLTIVREHVSEVRWPAPDPPTRAPISVVRELSRRVSGTRLGGRLHLGNRVVTVAAASSDAGWAR